MDGDRLSDDEVVANAIMAMVAGLETTTNLIGNGLLTLPAPPGGSGGPARRPHCRAHRGGGVGALRESESAHRADRA